MRKRRNRRIQRAAAYLLTAALVLSIGSGIPVLAGAEEINMEPTETENLLQTEAESGTPEPTVTSEPTSTPEPTTEPTTPAEPTATPEPTTPPETETDGPESEVITEPMETETETETSAPTPTPIPEPTVTPEPETETGNVPEETPEPIQTLQAVQASSPAPRANDVAKVEMNGSTSYYQSLDAAITAVGSGTATITLLANASITKFGSGGINGNVILEGGNYTITGDGMGFVVFGTLTIKSGHIDSSCVLTSAGTINIYGGNIDGVTLYTMPGFSVNVYGGTISQVQGGGSLSFKPLNFYLDKQSLTLAAGKSETLTATVDPAISAPGFGVSWTSDNTSVATVNNGTVTAVAPGTATITAQAGDKTATCTVTVKEKSIATVTDSSGNVTEYADLETAAAAASESPGSTLTLLDNVTGWDKTLTLSGNMTFDLGGYTFSGKGASDGQWFILLNVSSGNIEITNGTVVADYDGNTVYAVQVGAGATLSGDALYSSTGNVGASRSLALAGTLEGGTFDRLVVVRGGGKISGGIFSNNLTVYKGGILEGGQYQSSGITVDLGQGPMTLKDVLAVGYVGYGSDGGLLDRTTPGNSVVFTGEIKQHPAESHTYSYKDTSSGYTPGTFTYEEDECTSCGVKSTNGYKVTIPANMEIGKTRFPIAIENKLSQAKTVTLSAEDSITLTCVEDGKTKIVSKVSFGPLSAGQGRVTADNLIFGQPVYNNDEDAVIPAGNYSGTLTFTISVQ